MRPMDGAPSRTLVRLRSLGLLAVVRASSAKDAVEVSEALVEGSVLGIEVAFTTPGAEAAMRELRGRHAEQVYVSGNVHTNTIEGFWSLTKRGINGVYHAVSAKHLQGYLNEYAFRYNNRGKNGEQFRKLLLRAALSL